MLAFAVWLFGERLSPTRWLGAALVIAGLILVKKGT
jgi:drug/metabolite transporter (DMT)-like permease